MLLLVGFTIQRMWPGEGGGGLDNWNANNAVDDRRPSLFCILPWLPKGYRPHVSADALFATM